MLPVGCGKGSPTSPPSTATPVLPILTSTPTLTPTSVWTLAPTLSFTPSPSLTQTNSPTAGNTSTKTPTPTITFSPTFTTTTSFTATLSDTPTDSLTISPTSTATVTFSPTYTTTITFTGTPTNTPTNSSTATLTATPTATNPIDIDYTQIQYCPNQTPTVFTGLATYYTIGSPNPCSIPSASLPAYYVALSSADYALSGGCGAYIQVCTGAVTVVEMVADECPASSNPACYEGSHHLDMSQSAFVALFGSTSVGQGPVTWQFIAGTAGTNVQCYVNTGYSQYYGAFVFFNSNFPLTKVEAMINSVWTDLPRSTFNTWVASSGIGATGPYQFRLTDARGDQLTPTFASLTGGSTYDTGAQFPACP